MEYKTRTGSWNLARIIVKKRDESGNVTYVLYVVQKIDQDKKKELEYKQQLMETARRCAPGKHGEDGFPAAYEPRYPDSDQWDSGDDRDCGTFSGRCEKTGGMPQKGKGSRQLPVRAGKQHTGYE